MTVRDLFDAVVDLASEERADYLATHCDDEAQRLEVLRLVKASEDVGVDFLQPIPWRDVGAGPERAGTAAGAYTLVEEIARGGMSTVYLGRRVDGRYESDVAVKVLNAGAGVTAAQIDQERRALASLHHPNITRLLDAGELPTGEPYLVMELVVGQRLDTYCREQALEPREIVRLFLQVCAAVEAAHRSAILHRDLKPSNILVTPTGDVKLLDFGVSRSLARSGTTIPHGLWLTPEYASPEHAAGRPPGTGSDVYSLGVVLFEALTGDLPYEPDARGPLALANAITDGRTRPASEVRPDLDRDLDLVLAKALAWDATRRYPSVEQFGADLEAYLEGRPVRARAGGTGYRLRMFVQRHRAAVLAASLAGGLALGAVLVALERGRAAGAQNEAYRHLLYAAEIRLAQDAWEAGRLDETRALLARHVSSDARDTRGAEWHVLADLAATTEVVRQTTAVVNRLAISPVDGSVATAGNDGSIHLWPQAGTAPTLLGRHDGKTWAVAFSPDGSRVASGGTDGHVREWRLGTPGPGATLQLGSPVHALAYGPDGLTLVAGLADGRVLELDAPVRRVVHTLGHVGVSVDDVSYSPDGRWIAAAVHAPRVALWDRRRGRAVRLLVTSGPTTSSVAFSPGSDILMATARDGALLTWRLDTGALMHDERVLDGILETAAMTPDGRSVIAAHGVWISRWRASDWHLESRIAAHNSRVLSMAVSRDGSRMVSVGSDHTLKVRSLTDAAPRQLQHGAEIWGLAYSSDGTRLATAGNDGRVALWSSSGELMAEVNVNGNRARAVAFSPDGAWLASGHGDGTVRLWNPRSLQAGPILAGHQDQIRQVTFSTDSRRLAAASEDGSASVWDMARHRLEQQVFHRDRVRGVAFLPGRDLLVTGSDDRTLGVWRIEDGTRISTMTGHTLSVHGVSVSNDGRRIASAGADGTVRVWDGVTFAPVHTLSGHADRVWAVGFSPDGTRLVSASSDDTVRMWEPASGREMLVLRALGARRALAWSTDGAMLAVSASESVSIWNASPGRAGR